MLKGWVACSSLAVWIVIGRWVPLLTWAIYVDDAGATLFWAFVRSVFGP